MSKDPDASVILVASRGRQSVARIMECLSNQTAAPRLEVVIAARPEYVTELRGMAAGPFADMRVEPADFTTSARARIAAIEASRAPILIFAEDHAFPREDTWAARLIEAHDGPYVAVGPTMGNANPGTGLSWAQLICEYGPWLCTGTATELDALPGHNSSYKRSALVAYGSALPHYLEAEWVLHRDLREKGGGLMLLGDVTVDHVNFSHLGGAIGIIFWGGWMFAASRAADWSTARGMTYGLAAPVILGLRLVRSVKHLRRCRGTVPAGVSVLPPLIVLLASSVLGEALGYVLGDCGLRRELSRREYDRWLHVRAEEAGIFAGAK